MTPNRRRSHEPDAEESRAADHESARQEPDPAAHPTAAFPGAPGPRLPATRAAGAPGSADRVTQTNPCESGSRHNQRTAAALAKRTRAGEVSRRGNKHMQAATARFTIRRDEEGGVSNEQE